jgi:hypothetical protein
MILRSFLMSQKPASSLALVESVSSPIPPSAPALPAASIAVRRCSSAYKRAIQAYLDALEEHDSIDEILARGDGRKAYGRAMPLLDGYQGIRDFVACVGHGILIDAIPADRTGQLLYAAQLALALLAHQPKAAARPPQ